MREEGFLFLESVFTYVDQHTGDMWPAMDDGTRSTHEGDCVHVCDADQWWVDALCYHDRAALVALCQKIQREEQAAWGTIN